MMMGKLASYNIKSCSTALFSLLKPYTKIISINSVNFMTVLKLINNAKMAHLLIAFFVFAAVKLIIISGNEIISEGSDSVEYFLMAKAWFCIVDPKFKTVV